MLRTSTRLGVHAGLKLARLLELPERDFELRVRELESDRFFRNLLDTKVVSIESYTGAGFASKRFGGWGLSTSTDGISSVLDGKGDAARLLLRVGQERFEECFLREEQFTDADRARLCAITLAEVAQLRELVNKLYVQEEFDGASSTSAPPLTFSAVAGIMIEGGRPTLAFFNRDIWKGRYKVDAEKRKGMLSAMPAQDAKRLDRFLRELELLDRRKTTLYRVLEVLIQDQAEYFIKGDPALRKSLTQREVSGRLKIDPSVLNRLISNKSIELPWGLEAPMKLLMPSRKSLLRDRLYDMIREQPDSTDEMLRKKIDRLHGAKLSTRSIAQYRTELGLGNSRQRR